MKAIRFIDGFASVWLVFWLSFIAVYIHFGALGFSGLVILLGAVGWLVWLVHRDVVPMNSRTLIVPGLAFALFFGWLSLSAAWSPAGPETAYRLAGQVALTAALPALLLTRTEWRRTLLSQILMAVAFAGVAILALDVASGYGINTFLDPVGVGEDLNQRQGDAEMNIGRGHVAYAVILPLLLAFFATRLPPGRFWPTTITFIALILIGTMLNRLSIVPMIMLLAAPFFIMGYKTPRWGLRLSLSALAASIVFAPLVGVVSRMAGEGTMARLPMSWDHRLRMWDYSLSRITESPWIGKGLDSSRSFQEAFTTRIGVDVPFVSLHPHNIGLQTWVEAGAIGALLLTLAIVSLYAPLRRLTGDHAWRGAAVSGMLMSATVASAVTVGAWQYWWWGLLGLCLALVLLIPTKLDLLLCDVPDEVPTDEQ
ncbi:O-antigen polymerase [Algimonas arctica]|uniref:O-antigen polymerase n=1 Tax=Algimonas arctica TaxID=1479486 RepID=A0A8J3CQU2_9PROT|nr:O-antigen ligase family protein [Algimonas arctica]GHA98329.1 O-antigen polymerase [Algimonas arctica]